MIVGGINGAKILIVIAQGLFEEFDAHGFGGVSILDNSGDDEARSNLSQHLIYYIYISGIINISWILISAGPLGTLHSHNWSFPSRSSISRPSHSSSAATGIFHHSTRIPLRTACSEVLPLLHTRQSRMQPPPAKKGDNNRCRCLFDIEHTLLQSSHRQKSEWYRSHNRMIRIQNHCNPCSFRWCTCLMIFWMEGSTRHSYSFLQSCSRALDSLSSYFELDWNWGCTWHKFSWYHRYTFDSF